MSVAVWNWKYIKSIVFHGIICPCNTNVFTVWQTFIVSLWIIFKNVLLSKSACPNVLWRFSFWYYQEQFGELDHETQNFLWHMLIVLMNNSRRFHRRTTTRILPTNFVTTSAANPESLFSSPYLSLSFCFLLVFERYLSLHVLFNRCGQRLTYDSDVRKLI